MDHIGYIVTAVGVVGAAYPHYYPGDRTMRVAGIVCSWIMLAGWLATFALHGWVAGVCTVAASFYLYRLAKKVGLQSRTE